MGINDHRVRITIIRKARRIIFLLRLVDRNNNAGEATEKFQGKQVVFRFKIYCNYPNVILQYDI